MRTWIELDTQTGPARVDQSSIEGIGAPFNRNGSEVRAAQTQGGLTVYVFNSPGNMEALGWTAEAARLEKAKRDAATKAPAAQPAAPATKKATKKHRAEAKP